MIFVIAFLAFFSTALYAEQRYLIKVSKNEQFIGELFDVKFTDKFNLRFEHKDYFILSISEKELQTLPVRYEFLDIQDENLEYLLVLVRSEEDLQILRSVCPQILHFDGQTAIIKSDSQTIEKLSGLFKIKYLPEKIYQPKYYPEIYIHTYSIFAIEEDRKIIENLVLKLSTNTVYKYISELQNFQTRYTYSEKCNEVKDYLVSKSTEFRMQVSTESYIIGDKIRYNVIAEHKGFTSPEKIYVLCAHYDSMSNDPYNSAPGADDNASGCAALLSIMEIISQQEQKFNSTIRFVFFSGEEQGLIGSKNYSNYLLEINEKVLAVFNLDMIGYWRSGLRRDLDVITNVKSNWLADFLYQISKRYSFINLNITVDDGAWWGDHSSFWDNGFYALDLSEAFNWYSPDFNPYYHTINETVDKLDLNFAVDITKIAFVTVSQLANPHETEEIVILEPDGLNDTISQGEKYKIQWRNRTNSPVRIFYDTDIDGEGGVEIARLSSVFDSFLWDTTNVSSGKYYVYLSTSYGIYKCSSGPLTILPSLPQVKVYPNPFRVDKGHRHIVFSNLMANSEIVIYNLAAEIVKKKFLVSELEWPWDVKNESNEMIASGIYLFTVTSKDSKISRGKFAVIR